MSDPGYDFAYATHKNLVIRCYYSNFRDKGTNSEEL